MTVGERIKQARIQKGYTQEQLAKIMGYSGKTSISKIESAGNNVTTTTVTKFAKVLGVSESYIMGWDQVEWEPKTQEISIPTTKNHPFSSGPIGRSFSKKLGYGKIEQIYDEDERLNNVILELKKDETLRNSVLTYAEYLINSKNQLKEEKAYENL